MNPGENHGASVLEKPEQLAYLADLAVQQNRLLTEIHAPCTTENEVGPRHARGLAAYRANAQASALRALEAAFPVMFQLIGQENFAYLARDFWQTHPPTRGDLAQWGEQLASFAAKAPQLAELSFLPDVARIEWALHVCAGAADIAQDAPSFAHLTDCDPDTLVFTFAPGACAVASPYPAGDIALAHRSQGSLEAAFNLLKLGVPQTTLVWRQGLTPRLRVLHTHEQAFAQTLLSGQTLAQALDEAHANFDFNHWLTANVQNGLALGITQKPLS